MADKYLNADGLTYYNQKINGVVIKDNYDFAHYNLNALSNIEIDKILT